MDVDTLLTYFAVSAILSNTDGFTGPFEVDDHYQYFDPATGRFFILPWDPDNTFGSINDLPDADIFLNYERCVITRMVAGGPLQEAFFAKLEDVMNRVPAAAPSRIRRTRSSPRSAPPRRTTRPRCIRPRASSGASAT